jgi:2-oxoisovalerate dehydrogenase E1 component
VRIHSHSNSDRHELYRDDYELNYVSDYDPLGKYRRLLIRYNRFTEAELVEIEERVKQEVKEAHKKALAAPDPVPGSIFDYVTPLPFTSEKYPDGIHSFEGPKKKMIEALNETLKAEFRLNPDTFLYGQDMANKEKGGIFNVSKGMQKEFGKERIFNAPIAEDYIMGTASGMSRWSKKIRVVVEGAEFADYFWPAMEQFVNATHEYWRSKGQFSPNVTVRLASGGYIGGGLYHSQTIEGVLTTFPGTRVVYPSFADDAAGLLRTSIRSEGLTLFLEPKALYNASAAATPVPDDFEVPFGKARIRREGKDLSVITYGNTTHLCLEAADKIEKETGAGIEVIDLRSLSPLDKKTLLASVKKTGKALIVHEDKVFGGFGGELAALIIEEAFEFLDGPVKRVGSTFTPVGFNRILEKAILPNMDKILAAIRELLDY